MFLPPQLLDRLGNLELVARTVVRGFVAGVHPSALRGAGEDFDRHRAYQQGDDLRHLDWRLYGRTDRLFVREYRETSNLRAFLVVDATASMGYAEPDGVSKLRYATFAAAALAHLMLGTGDTIGLAAYGGAGGVLVPPRNRPGHLHQLLLELERLRPLGAADPQPVLERVGEALRLGGRVVLLSDLLAEDEGDALVAALGALRARGDEVMALRVATPAELGERALGGGVFYDPEHPERSTPGIPEADAGYRARVGGYYAALARRLRERGVEFVPLTTDEPVERALAGWIRARRA